MCLYVLYKTCAGVNIDPMGITMKKKRFASDWAVKINEFSCGKNGLKLS